MKRPRKYGKDSSCAGGGDYPVGVEFHVAGFPQATAGKQEPEGNPCPLAREVRHELVMLPYTRSSITSHSGSKVSIPWSLVGRW